MRLPILGQAASAEAELEHGLYFEKIKGLDQKLAIVDQRRRAVQVHGVWQYLCVEVEHIYRVNAAQLRPFHSPSSNFRLSQQSHTILLHHLNLNPEDWISSPVLALREQRDPNKVSRVNEMFGGHTPSLDDAQQDLNGKKSTKKNRKKETVEAKLARQERARERAAAGILPTPPAWLTHQEMLWEVRRERAEARRAGEEGDVARELSEQKWGHVRLWACVVGVVLVIMMFK